MHHVAVISHTLRPGIIYMIIFRFRYDLGVVAVYDLDTVLVTISIRLRRNARLGKQLGFKSENHIKSLVSTSKPVLEEAGEVSKSYQNRIENVSKSYQTVAKRIRTRIRTVSKP